MYLFSSEFFLSSVVNEVAASRNLGNLVSFKMVREEGREGRRDRNNYGNK